MAWRDEASIAAGLKRVSSPIDPVSTGELTLYNLVVQLWSVMEGSIEAGLRSSKLAYIPISVSAAILINAMSRRSRPSRWFKPEASSTDASRWMEEDAESKHRACGSSILAFVWGSS